jgi:hypothetical protein
VRELSFGVLVVLAPVMAAASSSPDPGTSSDFDDATGHVGRYLANAPFATGSFNVYVKNLGPWSGGLEYRYLGISVSRQRAPDAGQPDPKRRLW